MAEPQNKVDDESIRNLMFLTKNMDIEPKRNEFCYCMSGKKYKKCCMAIEDETDIESFELKELYLVPE